MPPDRGGGDAIAMFREFPAPLSPCGVDVGAAAGDVLETHLGGDRLAQRGIGREILVANDARGVLLKPQQLVNVMAKACQHPSLVVLVPTVGEGKLESRDA